ncbi:MAG: hypothetical protein Fur0014_05270 [Rubrivivax sp.]
MATDDFFRARLDTMIDLRHPLAVLATRMPWTEIEAGVAPAFAHRDRAGRLVEGADLFGPNVQLAGEGRRRVRIDGAGIEVRPARVAQPDPHHPRSNPLPAQVRSCDRSAPPPAAATRAAAPCRWWSSAARR